MNCGHTPSDSLAVLGCRMTEVPWMKTSPSSGTTSPPDVFWSVIFQRTASVYSLITLKVDVFPAPFGPSNARIVFCETPKLTSFTALAFEPLKVLEI